MVPRMLSSKSIIISDMHSKITSWTGFLYRDKDHQSMPITTSQASANIGRCLRRWCFIMWDRSHHSRLYGCRLRSWEASMPPQLGRIGADTDQDFHLDTPLRACTQHIEMLRLVVPPPSGEHCTSTARGRYHWCPNPAMDHGSDGDHHS